jgi:hypothetical protein
MDPLTFACFLIGCAVWIAGGFLVKQITGNSG